MAFPNRLTLSILLNLIIGLSGILIALIPLTAQVNLPFQHITKKDGLSQSSVFAITQDEDGFMWFGTRDGLNKYDGYEFTIYDYTSVPNSLISNDVRTLYYDRKSKNIWVGTSFGLCRFRPEYGDFVNYKKLTETQDNSMNIRVFYRDSKNRLWVGTSEGLFLYMDESDQFIHFAAKKNKPNYLSGNDIKVIHEDKKGTLWFGSDMGLDTLNAQNTTSFKFGKVQHTINFLDQHIKALLEDEVGNFWIGTQQKGILFWNRTTNEINAFETQIDNNQTVSNNNIRSMIWGEDGFIWIGTFNGLTKLNPQKQQFEQFFHNPSVKSSLSHSSVRALFLDKRNSLWVGTYYGGVDFSDAASTRFSNISHHPYQNSISNNIVSCFTEDVDGNWWIGTEGGGLNFYNQATKKFTVYQYDANNRNSISSNNIKHLLLDGDQLWIGTFNGGLNLLDTKTKQVERFDYTGKQPFGTTNNNIYRIYKEQNLLWIIMHGGGLNILDLAQQKNYVFKSNLLDKQTLISNLARNILVTSSNEKWIGTDAGLNKVITNTEGLPIGFEHFLLNHKIYTLYEDAAENLWVGTLSNGLYLQKKGSPEFENFMPADGLPGHSIFGILEDDNHKLWLSTNNGISQFNVAQKIFTNYDYSDGLENIEFNFNAFYKTRSGEMLFGGTKGITLFQPNDIYASDFIPSVVLTKLKVQNKEVAIEKDGILTKALNKTESITLKNNQASISISFAALDYFSPENNPFSYKLEGLDNDWITTTGQTEATYTIQNAGNYLFRLKAGNSDGVWNPTEKQLAIKVLPPPWKSTQAYFIYALLLLGVGFAILRFLRLRHRLRLEQLTKEKQKELHEMKVRFFTNITHEFRTPLTLILGQLEDLSGGEKVPNGSAHAKLFSAKKNANRLLNLVNQLLTFQKMETDYIQIRAEEQNIVNFLEEIIQSFKSVAFDREIDLQFHADFTALSVWFDRDKLEKVFYNLLSNAFKFTPDGGEIKLFIKQVEQAVIVILQDDGKGVSPELHEQIFKRFYESDIPFKRSFKGSGIGLAISKQMVELHAGNIKIASKKGKGATFTVSLPLGNQHFKPAERVETESFKIGQKSMQYIQPIFPLTKSFQTEVPKKDVPKDALKLLIVEDNEEILQYIQSIFFTTYFVKTAPNGKIALKIAAKYQPDLVISDIMMPEMDGITFCNLLKKDLQTSHIPIILLTANAAQEIKINSLEIGADDYVTKPFDPKELKLRVKNLANARIQLRNKFSRILNLSPTEITVTSADETFLKNAMDIVEKHIGNSDFGVVQFAYELAVSRPLLFTKLKAITNQTPNNFIKSIRLKRAAHLLKQRKINVAEVAYKVGFKDPRYFSKCFQKQFQQTPTQYMAQE